MNKITVIALGFHPGMNMAGDPISIYGLPFTVEKASEKGDDLIIKGVFEGPKAILANQIAETTGRFKILNIEEVDGKKPSSKKSKSKKSDDESQDTDAAIDPVTPNA